MLGFSLFKVFRVRVRLRVKGSGFLLIPWPSSIVLINRRHLPATPIMMTVITPSKSFANPLDLVSLSTTQS